MKKKLLVSMMLLAAIALGNGCSLAKAPANTPPPTPPAIVRIGHTPVPQSLFIAEAKGFFREAGLDVRLQKFASANLAMEALTHNDLDGIGPVSYSTLLAFESKSPNLFTVYEGLSEGKDTGWSALVIKPDAGIRTAADLKGKKIVMRSGSSSKNQGGLVIKALGLDLREVEFVQVDPALLVPTFAQPEISAFLDIQPFATLITQKKLGEVFIVSPRARYILDPYPTAGSVLRKDFAANNPEVAKKYIAAVDKAIAFMKANEAESRSILQTYLKLEKEVAESMPLPRFETLAQIDVAAIDKLGDIEVDLKILERKPEIKGWWTNP